MMAKIDKQTENSMISFLEKQLSDLGIELEQEKAKSQNNSLEKIQLKNNIELLTRVFIHSFFTYFVFLARKSMNYLRKSLKKKTPLKKSKSKWKISKSFIIAPLENQRKFLVICASNRKKTKN